MQNTRAHANTRPCNQPQASPAPAPKVILEDGASVAWNRLFFRNFVPPVPAGAAGAARRTALLSSAARLPGKGLNWESPNPFVTSTGGSAIYNLIVWHFQPAMMWVFGEAGVSDEWRAWSEGNQIYWCVLVWVGLGVVRGDLVGRGGWGG